MKTLVLTGFEPFDGYKSNPSEEAVRALDAKTVGGYAVKGVVLPLDYSRMSGMLDDALDTKPDVVLCCGQAERGAVTIERIAVNAVGTGRKDNYGNIPEKDVIDPEGPAAYFTNIDPSALAERLKQEGIPAFVSYHAGVFGCNWVIYSVMRRIEILGIPTRATFVHLPPLPQQALEKNNASLATLPLETSLRALTTIIKSL